MITCNHANIVPSLTNRGNDVRKIRINHTNIVLFAVCMSLLVPYILKLERVHMQLLFDWGSHQCIARVTLPYYYANIIHVSINLVQETMPSK